MTPDQKKDHASALRKFKLSASAFAEQRKRQDEDMRFVDFDDQWPAVAKQQRSGQGSTGDSTSGQALPPTPPRPTLVINQLRGPCQQVASIRRNARLALEFAPKGSNSTPDIANVFEDIVRGIQSESRATIARNWGANRAEKSGLGWYRIDTDYCEDDSDDPAAVNDQDIVYRRILNQASVYPDPFAQEPDFSDGQCLFITEDIPWSRYQDEYPDSALAKQGALDNWGELTGVGDNTKLWIFKSTGEDGTEGWTVRVAEYWELVRDKKTREKKVIWSKINAIEYLDLPQDWNRARYIPIVPVVGEESFVDGDHRWTGIVRPGKDAAISYNVMRSAQVEKIGLSTKSPWIAYLETIEPFLDWWKQSSIRNFFVLPIKAAYDKMGNLLPAPFKNPNQDAEIQAVTLAAQVAQQDVHTTTGVPPVALGMLDPQDRSGKAIQALQGQAEQGSGIYLDNLVTISMAYEGKILRDLIPRIYDRPGRRIPTVGEDGVHGSVILNWPFVLDQNGVPQPIPLDAWSEGQPVPQGATLIDLKGGEYTVAPTIGKSYPTRRKEMADQISNVMKVVPPEMAAAMAPAYIESLDIPEAKKIAAIAKSALPPQIASAYDDGAQAVPPAAQAKLAQAQGMIQALQAENQQLKFEAAAKLPQIQSDERVAFAKMQTDLEKQRISTGGTMTVGMAKVDAEDTRTAYMHFWELLAHDEKFALHFAKSVTDAAKQHVQNAHDSLHLGLEHAHDHAVADKAAQHSIDLATTQAALQPPPDEAGQPV